MIDKQFLGFYSTPSLFKNKIKNIEQFDVTKISVDTLDFDNLQIVQKMPLGKRVEKFFEFYINNSLRYNILSQNIQVIHNKNTLGEIDFILEDTKLNKHIHLELVYKFYLYDDRFEKELDKYIGQNRDDTLVKKLTKLEYKQFPLLFKDQANKYLSGIDLENIEQQTCFRANIFLPLYLKDKKLPLIDNNCIKGFYIHIDEFLSNEDYKSYEYAVPHRYDWIVEPKENNVWDSYEKVLGQVKFFLDLRKSPLVWLKKENTYESFFIIWWN